MEANDPPSVIVTFTQGFYVLDALWNEPAILTTMDIVTDGFGFMLAFGGKSQESACNASLILTLFPDLAWLPFIYSIQARYLSIHPVNLGYVRSAAIICVYLAGYYLFRASNNEKNRFRTNPNDPRVK